MTENEFIKLLQNGTYYWVTCDGSEPEKLLIPADIIKSLPTDLGTYEYQCGKRMFVITLKKMAAYLDISTDRADTLANEHAIPKWD